MKELMNTSKPTTLHEQLKTKLFGTISDKGIYDCGCRKTLPWQFVCRRGQTFMKTRQQLRG